MQVLGQVGDRSRDLQMYGMQRRLVGQSQRIKTNVETALLSARISCAMNVSESRGYPLRMIATGTDTLARSVHKSEGAGPRVPVIEPLVDEAADHLEPVEQSRDLNLRWLRLAGQGA